MAINGYFFNAVLSDGEYDRVYDAEDVTSYLDMIVGNGVFPNPSTNLQVLAGTGMTVNVQVGQGWIDGHKMINTAALPLAISAANALLARIDRIIFYVDHTAREMGIAVKTGTAAANPTAPALTRNATRYEMCLATVRVNKGATSITQATITDTRGDSSVCGFVQGLVQQADTSTLWNQWNASGQQMIATNQAEFDDWFDQVRDTLATATLLQKLEQVFTTTSTTVSTITVTDYIPSYKYSIDILEIYVNGLRLNDNDFSQTGAVVTLTEPITHAGTEVELVVYKSIDGSDAETVVEQVQEMQGTVDTLESCMYVASGTDDNIKLSQMVQAFLGGDSDGDYKQLRIDVHGALGCTTPAAVNTSANRDTWFYLVRAADASSTRRVILDFANCDRITINANSREAWAFLADTSHVEINNLQLVMSNAGANSMLFSGGAVLERCAAWLTGVGGLVGINSGKMIHCRMSVTAASGAAYCVSADGGTMLLDDCELLAYNASNATTEAVAVQVQANQTQNVLVMDACSCPVRSRSGYKQDNVVKINSGFYCLTANMLGMAAAKYATGDGKTEIGTMLISK